MIFALPLKKFVAKGYQHYNSLTMAESVVF